jgi:hypothetical protein
VYTLLWSFLKQLAPTWRQTQLANLSLLAHALFKHQSLNLAELARAYPVATDHRVKKPKHILFHQLKRLRRFLNNPRPDFDIVFRHLVKLGNVVYQGRSLVLPVLLDPTYFGDYTTIVIAVPRSGRALPVAVRAFKRNLEGEGETSQNEIVQKLVKGVRDQIAETINMVLVADREYANASFFQFLKSIQEGFAIRVDAQTWIEHADYKGPLGQLPIKPGGRRLWFVGALYGQEAREKVNLVAIWQADQKEPWFIATTLDDPKLAAGLYRKRMKIEHGFRDWKHHLKLKGTLKVISAQRAQALLRTLALLYWFLCLVGIRVNRPQHQARVCYRGKPSMFFLALQLFKAGVDVANQAGQRVAEWAYDQLWPYYPLPPAYKLRYLRFRRASLQFSGSP